MSRVGAIERITQNRIVQLFQQLGYHYLGNWSDRPNNSNIETEILTTFLRDKQGYSDSLITKALYELNKVAGDQSKSLYDINKEVYSLLRYGVRVKAEAGENTQTVWLINWEEALENDFAIAEEVTVKGENTKRPDIVLYVNGIALGVLELKRSTISVSQGIARTSTIKNLFLSNPSSPPCNLSWQVTTPKDSATPLQKRQKSITSPGKKKVTATSPIP